MSWFSWLGAVLAAVMSFQLNHSYVWSIVHAILGWFYVAYALVFRW